MKAQALGSVLAALLLASLRVDAGSQEDAKRDVEAVERDRAADQPKPSLVGSWGGDGAGMVIAADGARLEFDCAQGTIAEPIRTDDAGSFEAKGTYVREGPGPTRKDDRRSVPARYRGKVEGDSLSLTVELPGSDSSPGTFTLTRGRLPRVRACG